MECAVVEATECENDPMDAKEVVAAPAVLIPDQEGQILGRRRHLDPLHPLVPVRARPLRYLQTAKVSKCPIVLNKIHLGVITHGKSGNVFSMKAFRINEKTARGWREDVTSYLQTFPRSIW